MRFSLLTLLFWPAGLLAQTSFVVQTGNANTVRAIYQAIPYICSSFENVPQAASGTGSTVTFSPRFVNRFTKYRWS